MIMPAQPPGIQAAPLPWLAGWRPPWFAPRLWLMLIGWGAIGLSYGSAHWLQGPGRSLPEWLPDRLLPFDPLAIWPYLSMFILVPLAYLRCPPPRQYALAAAMQGCAAVAWCCFLLFPTTLAAYPAADPGTLSGWLLKRLMQLDSSQNCLPSLHAALTLLSVYALRRNEPRHAARAVNLMLWLWAILISLSIIVLRRHLFIDLLTGLLLGHIAALRCGLIGKRAANAAMPVPRPASAAACRRSPTSRETLP